MSQVLSQKLLLLADEPAFWCPGCGALHRVPSNLRTEAPGPKWQWNEDAERPTFSPSILVRTIRPNLTDEEWALYDEVAAGPGGTERVLADPRFRFVCHSFVTDGRIQYLSDCTHQYAGQTIDLPDLPQYIIDRNQHGDVTSQAEAD